VFLCSCPLRGNILTAKLADDEERAKCVQLGTCE